MGEVGTETGMGYLFTCVRVLHALPLPPVCVVLGNGHTQSYTLCFLLSLPDTPAPVACPSRWLPPHLLGAGTWLVSKDAFSLLMEESHFLPLRETRRSEQDAPLLGSLSLLLGGDPEASQPAESPDFWGVGVRRSLAPGSHGHRVHRRQAAHLEGSEGCVCQALRLRGYGLARCGALPVCGHWPHPVPVPVPGPQHLVTALVSVSSAHRLLGERLDSVQPSSWLPEPLPQAGPQRQGRGGTRSLVGVLASRFLPQTQSRRTRQLHVHLRCHLPLACGLQPILSFFFFG